MGRTTRASLKGRQAEEEEEDSTFDYNEVKHRMVTTPIVPGGRGGGADKRKAAGGGGGGGGSGRAGDKENQSSNAGGGASSSTEQQPSKRAKTGGGGGAAAAAPQQQQQGAVGSVRYPKIDYAREVPAADREFTRADVPGEEKLVHLAARVMEADACKVEEMLCATKYSHLSQEMERFAGLVEQRLVQALKEDAAQEEKERKELARLEAKKAEGLAECAAMDAEMDRLRTELAAWEAEGQRLAGPGPKKALEKTKALEAAQEAQHSPYLSYVMKQTVALLESGARVKREALGAATELVEALEAQAPRVEETEAAAAEKQRELAQAFQGAQFAGLPDVHVAPQRAAKGLASTTGSAAKAGGK